MLLRAEGSMFVLLDDTVTLVDARGPELDQGAALRLLAEMSWYPTALFDPRALTWAAIERRERRLIAKGAEGVVACAAQWPPA
jgi:hypothetical protein